MVLAGLVNKELVQALAGAGVRAAGLCGADGASFDVLPRRASDPSVDLGYVGDVVRVDRALVETLLGSGFLPVVATAAPLSRAHAPEDERARAHFYNVNADLAAGPLARALECDALLFLTDVPGVLDGEQQRIECLTREGVAQLRERGVISGGMIPKVEAALAALASTSDCLVKIAPAAGPDAVLRALDDSTGTRFARTLAPTEPRR
jgi:acetylglutamate kinase